MGSSVSRRLLDRLSARGWTAQIIGGLAVAFIWVPIGSYMNSPKLIVYGVAAGVTIVVWVVAHHLAAVVSDKPEATVAAAPSTPVVSPDKQPPSAASVSVQNPQAPVVISQNQMGGQTAHTITNIGPQPRKASPKAIAKLVEDLKALPPQNVEIEVVHGDAEATALGHQLSQALQAAGWQQTAFATSMFPAPMTGLIVSAPGETAHVKTLLTWCKNAGLSPKFSIVQLDRVHIVVGTRE